MHRGWMCYLKYQHKVPHPPVFVFTEGPYGRVQEVIQCCKIPTSAPFHYKSLPYQPLYLQYISMEVITKSIRDLGMERAGHFMLVLEGNHYWSVYSRIIGGLGGHVLWCSQGMG